jgi:hypothetical protein
MVGLRRFLPKRWTDNPERMARAGVPEDKQIALTKSEIAIEEIVASSPTERVLRTRLDDYDRLRLTPVSPPCSSGRAKRVGAAPPEQRIPAIRQAIIDVFARPPPKAMPPL